ncbi:efflux RND transporter periplasmic adaptor subunit [Parabacteroides acidifaciens]|uniref:Efflux RND transporter periplasmic adaptor subunit n=1 Tax=Parabacteroides acidifaciens TaxID=2290935 RepID=A0A3D8HGB6_9BACT|nr:efflux RND transporter periplasmic adaptor subunit [Parabacteroides acidifaciens]MBC8601335.1 efflux RND transporter periplasmic adaptor subunit [Parabacteroides acidifaciens]RDU50015.1 efflux RND transporter periplasmic adaptor subunit [Parabacteroides acidifaciens]
MNKNNLLIILLLPLFASCGKQVAVQEKAADGLMLTDSLQQVISIDTVRETALNNELLLNGRVTFDAGQVAHVYPIFGGTIAQVNVEIGDYIRKGDVLAVIRSSEVADFEKQQKDAEHQLALANRNLEATRDMLDSGTASERDLLQAEQEAANVMAEVKRLREVYDIYQINANSTYNIVSPVSGFVVEKNISKNMLIRSDQGEELFTVSGLDNVWVMADVYEGDIRKVNEGADVRITTLAYGKDKEFTGTIDKVYNILDDESKTMKVRIKLNNKDYMLKPGMFTNVYVQCRVEGELMPRIPAHTLIFEGGKQYVVCVGPDGYLRMQEVDVYKQTDKYCYLNTGLKEGDRVVNKNALLVYNALK